MIDDYMKILSLGMIIPMTPPIVQKKLIFELLNLAKIKLTEDELGSLEKQYGIKEPAIIYPQNVRHELEHLKVILEKSPKDALLFIEESILSLKKMEEANNANRR